MGMMDLLAASRAADARDEAASANERLKRIEERLDRIEQLLLKLMDEKENSKWVWPMP